MDIKEYRDAVKYFSDNQENFEFTNKGVQHAASVVANLIRTSKDELLIYSGNMSKDVANDPYLVKMLNTFLKSGKTLRIVLDEMPKEEEQSESLKQIITSSKNMKNSVILKIDKDKSFSKAMREVSKDKEVHHFMVADGIAYRFEIDALQYKAICNFNDKKIAGELKVAFDRQFEAMQ
ncbi:MAG: hypothetical protein WC656_01790 [Sulfurimonas sp.]|jgi:hypothetical protein